jgi:hypothetical protein
VAQAKLLDLTAKRQLLVHIGRGGRGAPEVPRTIAASGNGGDGYAAIIFLSGPIDAGQDAVSPISAQDAKQNK